MTHEFIDNIVVANTFRKNGTTLHPQKIRKILDTYPNISAYIYNRYVDSLSVEETIKRMSLHIEKLPLCSICGKPVKFVGGGRIMLKSCGDTECSKAVNALNGKNTCISKYGVSNAAKTQDSKNKMAATNIERYGHVCALQNNEVHKKTIETNLAKYGCVHAQSSDSVKQKIVASNEATCATKYGVRNVYQLINVKNKSYETKKLHGTINTSLKEDAAYELLMTRWSDTVRQYKSDKYPFACDFYIPSLDLYIECQYSWVHGTHPYGDMDDDETVYDSMMAKTDYYKHAAHTWRYRDVNKRITAKTNNLNWLEFFTPQDFEEWFNKNK